MRLQNNLRAIILAGALPFGMAAQTYQRPDVAPSQNPGVQQSQGRQMGNPNPENAPATNPGFDREIRNTTAPGQTAETNSTMQPSRDGNMGFDLGWLGLLGIAGLFGLARRNKPVSEVREPAHATHE
jgi:MYXO-CTERM domain-containing protein